MTVNNIRIGQGYDVHKLVPDRKLIIGGIEIPHSLGLLGHSDADVALHALTDALLGAANLGDIGSNFPDNDSSYKDIDSKILLKKAYQLIQESGYALINFDLTIIAQQPKMSPYIPEMKKVIAKVLECDESQCSIKATTTEKLGFVGREEGIAAMCVVLLESSRERQ